jgi:hypothetical protein
MGFQMVKGFCAVYLASRHSDIQMDVKVLGSETLESAIRIARSKVENMVFAGAGAGMVPVGFVIENSEGDELFRWYRED